MWDSTGRLVAQSRQLALLPRPSRALRWPSRPRSDTRCSAQPVVLGDLPTTLDRRCVPLAPSAGDHMRGITGRTTRTIVLLAALMMLPGQQSLHLLPRPAALSDSPVAPATVTSPDPDNPVSVAPATGSYAGGVRQCRRPGREDRGQEPAERRPGGLHAGHRRRAPRLPPVPAPPRRHRPGRVGQPRRTRGRREEQGHPRDHRSRAERQGQVRAVADTDGGQWDGNKRWDRALGPFQFIPSSWRVAGVDMDADGVRDPQNIFDAAGAAMVYLCAGGRDLATPAGLRQGVLAYNHSTSYLRLVLAWKAVLDNVDLNGVGEPTVYGAWALPGDADRARRSLRRGRHRPAHCPARGEALHSPRRSRRRPGRPRPSTVDPLHRRRTRRRATGRRRPRRPPTRDRTHHRADDGAPSPTTPAGAHADVPGPAAPAPTPTASGTDRDPGRPDGRRRARRAPRPPTPPRTRPHRPTTDATRTSPAWPPADPTAAARRPPRRPDGQSNCERFTENTKRRPGYSLSDQSRSVPGQ